MSPAFTFRLRGSAHDVSVLTLPLPPHTCPHACSQHSLVYPRTYYYSCSSPPSAMLTLTLNRTLQHHLDLIIYHYLCLCAVQAISAGEHYSMVLRQEGSVWATGFNRNGQHGDGTTSDKHAFAMVVSSGLCGTFLPTSCNTDVQLHMHILTLIQPSTRPNGKRCTYSRASFTVRACAWLDKR